MRILPLCLLTLLLGCGNEETPMSTVPQNSVYEISFTADGEFANPYTDVVASATFENGAGEVITRPAFWDGGNTWKVRFSGPKAGDTWRWQTTAEPAVGGLHDQRGQVTISEYTGENALLQKGLLKMSPGKRNVVHADGSTFLVVADTPWAIPFRATVDQVEVYAKKRQAQGFNSALLMTLQPDMKAEGPEGRNIDQGFARAFSDLPEGQLVQLRPEYFQYLDTIIETLLAHEIVPVYQPVFHGFGWKGLDVLGNVIEPAQYERYTKYLLARYGAQPAFWLLAGDNGGRDPGVEEAGIMMEAWDSYRQPTGLHYNPCDDYLAEWAVDNDLKHCEHYNKSFQDADWLDFQWAQTGHGQEHQYHKVERMYDNLPTKAAANGEPTYEGMNDGKNGLGWWQGEDAWGQLFAGGTMGVVYGAAGLWQWKVSADEEGWTAWATQPMSWRDALDLEGARYVGYVNEGLKSLPLADMEKRPDLSPSGHQVLAVPGKAYLAYAPQGGAIGLTGLEGDLQGAWFDPRTGIFQEAIAVDGQYNAPSEDHWILILEAR
jgi:hypothetical protein